MTEQTIERLAGGVAGAVPEKERKEQVAGQWQLIWWRFRRNNVALVAGAVVGLIYFVAILAEFLAPVSSDFYNGRYIGADIISPAYDKVAELCGAKGYRADKPGEIAAALSDAFASGRPAVIQAKVDPNAIVSFRRDAFKHRSGG